MRLVLFRFVRTTAHAMSDLKKSKALRQLNKAGNKLIKEENGEKSEPAPADPPYFSPIKTRNRIKIEYEQKQESKGDLKMEPKVPPKSKAKRPAQKLIETKEEENESDSAKVPAKTMKWEPKKWREMLENIREMRRRVAAPVDTMGCDKCPDSLAEPKAQRYHHLLSLMLSSQTKDQITFDTMTRLKQRLVPLTPDTVLTLADQELEDLLRPVSFYKTKTKHIKITSKMLVDEYDGDIPDSLEGLLKLPGVGQKMAHLCMKGAWKVISGIGVDTHVHRISNRLRWVPKPTNTPEETRKALESWLPQEYWEEVNELLVGHGQTICSALRPKCDQCCNASICPAAVLKPAKKSKK